MNSERPSFEDELRGFAAAPLDDDFLARLEACAEGTDLRLSPGEQRFEAALRRIPPARLEADSLARFDELVRDVPFAKDGKIVYFPKSGAARPARQRRPMWAAAAAVALIGAASALLMPDVRRPSGEGVAALPPVAAPAPVAAGPAAGLPADFVPAAFNRGVSEVSEEGIVWKSRTQPHSVVRVVYQDSITLKDKHGRTVQVEQPRVEYMLVPARTD